MTQAQRPRILFIQLLPSSFVEDDAEILSSRFEVRRFQFTGATGRSRLENALRMAGAFVQEKWWLWRQLPGADMVYGWFADYHMFLPVVLARLWRRPCVVVLGGFDANALPDLRYGLFCSRWRGFLARIIVRRATFLLAVTPGLIHAENRFASWPSVHHDGILAHVPGLTTPHEVIPTGFRPDRWPLGPALRDRIVCTTALVGSPRTFLIKGLDLLIQVARGMPETAFRLVGVSPEMLAWIRRNHDVPENLQILPPRSRDGLSEFYQEGSVYLQPSRTEGGLPMALGEAMLSGCIPVVADVGGMPGTVGDIGFLAERPDPDRIAQLVQEALRLGEDPIAGPAARDRARSQIVRNFSLDSRRDRLLRRLEALRRTSRSAGGGPAAL